MNVFILFALFIVGTNSSSSSYAAVASGVHQFIFTGGPAGGKSTILEHLRKETLSGGWSVAVIDELATDLMQGKHKASQVPSDFLTKWEADFPEAYGTAKAAGAFDNNAMYALLAKRTSGLTSTEKAKATSDGAYWNSYWFNGMKFPKGNPLRGLHLAYMEAWDKTLIREQLKAENDAAAGELAKGGINNVIVICDRGLPDDMAYTNLRDKKFFAKYLQGAGLDIKAMWSRYEAVVKIDSVAVNFPTLYEKFKQNNPTRSEDAGTAKFLDGLVEEVYQEFPDFKTNKYHHLKKYPLSPGLNPSSVLTGDLEMSHEKLLTKYFEFLLSQEKFLFSDLPKLFLNNREKEWLDLRKFFCTILTKPFQACPSSEDMVATNKVAAFPKDPPTTRYGKLFFWIAAIASCFLFHAFIKERKEMPPQLLASLEEI